MVMQQYMIKDSIGLGFMIQFKAKTPNNILLSINTSCDKF